MNQGDNKFLWKTNQRAILIGQRTLIMGIVNVTPDSFFDGGHFLNKDAAIEQALRMVDQGADIIDIGGESTRPGSTGVGLKHELKRVMPVIEGLIGKINVPVSIDTTKAETARIAISAGVEIINDISALRFDKQMMCVASETKAGIVLMHMRNTPKDMQSGDLTYQNLLADIGFFLHDRMEMAKAAGIALEQIAIDPGLGFGKTMPDNMKILKYLHHFKSLNRPILTGVSRKSFTASNAEEIPSERLWGTAAAVSAAILGGCNIVRVHDVTAMKKVATIADRIAQA